MRLRDSFHSNASDPVCILGGTLGRCGTERFFSPRMQIGREFVSLFDGVRQ